MYKEYFQDIKSTDNVIIGLGDSFTQGVGAYPLEIWKKVKDKFFNIDGQKHIELQYKNSWPSKLSEMIGYKFINLGINGIGNRAAVKELYLSNPLKKHTGNVIVVFMMSGTDRADFIRRNYNDKEHLRWLTIWPLKRKSTSFVDLETSYLKHVYSEKFATIEAILNIAEAQTYCNASGYRFAFCSAFDAFIGIENMEVNLGKDKHLLDLINWNNFIRPGNYNNFMELICHLENHPTLNFLNFHSWFSQINLPTKYLTPCMHWTIEAQEIVAKEILKFLIDNDYLDQKTKLRMSK